MHVLTIPETRQKITKMVFPIPEWLSRRTNNHRTVPWLGNLWVRLRASYTSNDEHPYAHIIPPMRYRRHGPNYLRIRQDVFGLQRCLLPLCKTGCSIQISGHRQKFRLV